MNEIGRLVGIQGHLSIQKVFSETSGTPLAERSRSVRRLSMSEREVISRGLIAGQSIRSIAGTIGRTPSTVSRKIKGNRDRRYYRAHKAEAAAWDRAKRPKRCKLLAKHPALSRPVAQKLQSFWAPRQIAGWLRNEYSSQEH